MWQSADQGGLICGAIKECSRSLKAIVERVFINFREKNAVLANFCDKNAVIQILFINSKCVLMIQQQSQIYFKYHQRMEILSLKSA